MAELTYKWAGDYLIPDLTIKGNNKPIGKYSRMRLRYLQKHRKGLYSVMLLNGTLQDHLAEIDETARERMERMVKCCAEREGINEELKARDPMEWVRRMHGIKAQAEEIALSELVYE
ncbi:MAG: TnpV protein [Clostridia bacterium]|nr:TnpV protein [Clostridia bacterium]